MQKSPASMSVVGNCFEGGGGEGEGWIWPFYNKQSRYCNYTVQVPVG